MDNNQAFGLEFLDLTGVDDHERQWVLDSICSTTSGSNFPWFIGDEGAREKRTQEKLNLSSKTVQYTNTEVQNNYPPTIVDHHTPTSTSHYNLPVANHIPVITPSVPILPVASTTTLPVNNILPAATSTGVNNQYYAPQFIQQVGTVPMNYVNNPVTAIYTTYPTYPVKSPVYYGAPPTQQIFVTQTNTCTTPNTQQQYFPEQDNAVVPNSYDQVNADAPNDYGYATLPDYNQSNNYVNGDYVATDAMENVDQVPVDINNQYNVNNVQDNPEEISPNPVVESAVNGRMGEIKNEIANVVQDAEDKQNDTVAKPSSWGVGKSWASLFSPPASKQVAAPTQTTMNGSIQSPLTEPVKTKNNQSCPFKNPKKDCFVDPDCYRMGEFLATYEIDGRTYSLQPRGLINQSNYCYINSILQALIACPPMYNLLFKLAQNITSNEKRKKTPVIDGICKFVKEFKPLPANMRVTRRSDPKNQKKDQGTLINTDIPFEPAWIYKMLNGIRTDLIEGRQEDAEEFLCCLLNNLNDEMLELIKLVQDENSDEKTESNHIITEEEDREWQVMGPKNKGSVTRKTVFEQTPITNIFGGSLRSRIHRTGDTDTENTQPFFTLQLNIEKVNTVKEALEALPTKYQLEGLTSSKTNEQVEAWQQVMLDKLPMILVLHLKCFDFKLDGCTKIIKALEFPIDLKIDAKLLSSSKTVDQKQKQYKLFAVVYHDGKEATKGHYVTDAFHVGYNSWLRYDDASVKAVQEEHVLNPQGTRVPYLLFYRRGDTIRSR